LQAATKAERIDRLRPNFRQYFERYFLVRDAPENRPYVVPFGRTSAGETLLFNRNVAGSYAPSSMRDVNPLFDVLEIDGDGTYTLLENHSDAVRARILPRPLPACGTACFLYRDYGFTPHPTGDDLIEQLNRDFGYPFNNDILTSGLFSDDRTLLLPTDFEELVEE
jgi:hypothetical protein